MANVQLIVKTHRFKGGDVVSIEDDLAALLVGQGQAVYVEDEKPAKAKKG